MRVLHVTECYEGGVRRAIDTMVRLTPELEHFLIADLETLKHSATVFAGKIPMVRGYRHRVAQIQAVAEEIEADVIHAHSSWAGAYARTGSPKTPVVYEPHCFVFDDPFRGPLAKQLFKFAEKRLGRNTAAIIALTPHEQKLACEIVSDERVVLLPNVPSLERKSRNPEADRPRAQLVREIVMVGRLARQKDPQFFAELNNRLVHNNVPAKLTWIGDGEESYRRALAESGVEVTGWLNDDELIERLSHADLYFHSAAYEGFPLSVLDAAHVGLPILARNLPCFEGFPLQTVTNIDETVKEISEFLNSADVRERYEVRTRRLLSMMTPQGQVDSLYRAYEIAAGTRKEIFDCVS